MTADQAGDVFGAAYHFCKAVSAAAGRQLLSVGEASAWYAANLDELHDTFSAQSQPVLEEAAFLA